jgi:hypothetical protein
MRTGYAARMEETEKAHNILVGNPEGKEKHFRDVGVSGRIILKLISTDIGCEDMD